MSKIKQIHQSNLVHEKLDSEISKTILKFNEEIPVSKSDIVAVLETIKLKLLVLGKI